MDVSSQPWPPAISLALLFVYRDVTLEFLCLNSRQPNTPGGGGGGGVLIEGDILINIEGC